MKFPFLIACLSGFICTGVFVSQATAQINPLRTQAEIQALNSQITTELQRIRSASHAEMGHDHYTKCITPLVRKIKEHNDQLDAETRQLVESTFKTKEKVADLMYTSPSGLFTIHYDTTGSDAVPMLDSNSNGIPDYVEWAGEAADSSYNHEIITLGFDDPIPNGRQYDIFLEDLDAFGAYGLTNNDQSAPFPCRSRTPLTCIYVENDFVGYPPNTAANQQKGALEVTIAHELKHAIQYVQNRWTGDSDRWAEMDATLMEEVVYDDVNDYYNYIAGFSTDLFARADISVIPGSYEDITFSLFFHERFSPLFWTEVWNRITDNRNLRLLTAVAESLPGFDGNYEEALLEAYMWHFASGNDFSDAAYGFDERMFYPGPTLNQTYNDFIYEPDDTMSIAATAAHYYLLEPEVVSDGFLKFDLFASSPEIQAGLLIYNADNGDIEPYFITSPNPDILNEYELEFKLSDADKIGLVIVNSSQNSVRQYAFAYTDYFISNNDTIDIVRSIQLSQNYPNPFNPVTTIRVELSVAQNVTLEVFDTMGRRVQSLYDGRLNRGYHNFFVDGSGLASGTYLYRLVSEEGVQIKKMTLIK